MVATVVAPLVAISAAVAAPAVVDRSLAAVAGCVAGVDDFVAPDDYCVGDL